MQIKFRLIKDDEVVGFEKPVNGGTLEWLYSKDNEEWRPDFYISHDAKEMFTGILDDKANEIYHKDKCLYWYSCDGECYVVEIEYQLGAFGFTDPSNNIWVNLYEEPLLEVVGRAKK